MEEAPRERFVTILFTDLVGSSSLFARLGDDAADAARREHFAALRGAIAEHGGREVKSTGDGLMVAFGSAVDAVRCAVDMQRATSGRSDLDLRVGLDAGEPLPEGDDLYGTPVIVASRLCDAARPGEILVSDVVCRIAGPRLANVIEPGRGLRLRGLGDSVRAARVRWREEASDEHGARVDAPPPPRRQITVLIADDQALVRKGFRGILEDEPGVHVVGEAADGREAIELARTLRPDVVLMDIRMPDIDGLEATRRILTDVGDADPVAILMLTTFDANEYVYEALRAGASGFLLKDVFPEDLIAAIRVVASGDALIAPAITKRLIEQFVSAAAASAPPPPVLAQLTAREVEVLTLVARGLSDAEIADELAARRASVRGEVKRILGKIGSRDRVQAVVFAYEAGLVAPGDAARA